MWKLSVLRKFSHHLCCFSWNWNQFALKEAGYILTIWSGTSTGNDKGKEQDRMWGKTNSNWKSKQKKGKETWKWMAMWSHMFALEQYEAVNGVKKKKCNV